MPDPDRASKTLFSIIRCGNHRYWIFGTVARPEFLQLTAGGDDALAARLQFAVAFLVEFLGLVQRLSYILIFLEELPHPV